MEEMVREKQREEWREDMEHVILMGLQSPFQVSMSPVVLLCLISGFPHDFQCILKSSSSLEPARWVSIPKKLEQNSN